MKNFFFVLVGLCFFQYYFGQVTITKPSFKFTACSLPSQYIDLGLIMLTESTNGDFALGNAQSIQISAPSNFQFEPSVGSVISANGGNVRNTTISISSSLITITYDCTGINKSDEVTISGIRIRVTSLSTGTFNRTGGNASISGLTIGTPLTNNISALQSVAGRYRTVINTTSNLNWSSSTTWECGSVPPNDGTAEIYISPYNGGFSVLNSVVFGNTTVKSIIVESGANFSPPGNSGSTLVVNEDFTIETGAYFRQYNWANNGKNAIEIKGNFTNNGEMTTSGSNNTYDLDITFNGTSPQTISGSGIFRMIGNGSQMSTITFDNPKGITLNASFSTVGAHGDAGTVNVNGLLTFGSSSNQFTGAGAVNVNGQVVLKASTFYGHFANTGARTLGATSTVEFTNSSSLITSTNIPTMNLYRLISSVGASGTLTATGNLNVSNQLTLNAGKILMGTNTLTIGTSLTNLGIISHSSGFVMGKVKRWFNSTNSGNESGLYPLGISNKRNFVKVEYTQATDGGTLTAEWIPSSMGTNFTNEPIPTSCNGNFEIYTTASGYWSMTPGDGITNAESKKYNITLFADGLLDFTDDCHVTALKRQGSNPWLQSGIHIDNTGDAISPNVQRIGATGWSNWGFAGGSGTPLPVELVSFNSNCNEGQTILTWITSSENNSSSFDIEISPDGSTWETNGSINAAGFSNEEIEYSYKTERVGIQRFARLKQIDNNGDFKLYGPVEISCSPSWNLSTFPNPSQESFNVLVRSKYLDMTGILNLIDLSGNVICSKNVTIQEGINVFPISNEKLSNGAYFIQLITENQDPIVFQHLVK
ncbi:MAG: T9SS type A sorting domain-containing protein [Crocinitomicaceae bacterium]|jgi:hypothetical protein